MKEILNISKERKKLVNEFDTEWADFRNMSLNVYKIFNQLKIYKLMYKKNFRFRIFCGCNLFLAMKIFKG